MMFKPDYNPGEVFRDRDAKKVEPMKTYTFKAPFCPGMRIRVRTEYLSDGIKSKLPRKEWQTAQIFNVCFGEGYKLTRLDITISPQPGRDPVHAKVKACDYNIVWEKI